MLSPAEAQRLGQKYMERHGAITDTMIVRHLHGAISLATPAAVDGRAHLLPLDIDGGGIDAIQNLIGEAARRKLWAFGQYCRRQGLAETNQRGYVWLPFDRQADAQRLQELGAQLIAANHQLDWKIEARAFHAVTRLPLARHMHTGRFGSLVIGDRLINIDLNPAGAIAELHHVYHENFSASLPELPLPPQRAPRLALRQNDEGITINGYNQAHDVADLLRFYGARPTSRRRLYFCPFHPDEHASLSVYTQRGQQYCRCFSAHSDCPLATHTQNDAFNVYCIGEGIDAKAALRRLNRRE
jgi:hypothetical protein